eukprot:7497043-Heterocapsa_arctica.AAC.1
MEGAHEEQNDREEKTLRTEQLFMEAQANKAEQKDAAAQRKIKKLLDKDNGNLDQRANKKIKTDK